MVTVYLRGGHPVTIPDGVAVAATDFPSKPGADQVALGLAVVTADGKMLAVFRQKEVGGYSIEG
jgi:hypothetical protein